MNPWKNKQWHKFYDNCQAAQTGLRLHFQQGIDSVLRSVFLDFARWLRINYPFPVRINVYIKNSNSIKAMDGELVSATFFGPDHLLKYPYVKIAAGDHGSISESSGEFGEFNAICDRISSLAHELTHYFKWINDMDEYMSDRQCERQARYYQKTIVYDYLDEQGYDLMESLGIPC